MSTPKIKKNTSSGVIWKIDHVFVHFQKMSAVVVLLESTEAKIKQFQKKSGAERR